MKKQTTLEPRPKSCASAPPVKEGSCTKCLQRARHTFSPSLYPHNKSWEWEPLLPPVYIQIVAQSKKQRKTIEWERLEISSRKLEIPREHSCKDGHNAAAAAAAAKSLQSCPTLCNPIDGSPPGPAVPGILQARTLEWVAISSSNA